jgi:hypothetical protein
MNKIFSLAQKFRLQMSRIKAKTFSLFFFFSTSSLGINSESHAGSVDRLVGKEYGDRVTSQFREQGSWFVLRVITAAHSAATVKLPLANRSVVALS